MPTMAIRTISLEKVRLERNEIREAIKEAKFKVKTLFLYFSKDANFSNGSLVKLAYRLLLNNF